MKSIIYILILAFGLGSCNNQTTKDPTDKGEVDALQAVSSDKQKQSVYVKDESQYDKTFIDGLADYNEPIKLIDNYILTGQDTTYFPDDLSLNKSTTFKAAKDNNKFVLTVTRTNLTNLSYNFQLIDKDNNTIGTRSGKAVLSSTFFLGSEGDDDTETQSGYGSQEYRDNNKDARVSIRIEVGRADGSKQRAKITFGSDNNVKKALSLDECPTLRTE